MDKLKALGMLVAALALSGVLLNSLTAEELDPADYPECFDIVRNLGSHGDALCVSDGGDVIKLREYSAFDEFHPAG